MKKINLVRADPGPTRNGLTDTPSYLTAHKRVYRAKGKASLYLCIDCNEQAHEWSYNGHSEQEMHGKTKQVEGYTYASPYSPDPMDYSPRCRPCHKAHDRSAA